MNERLGPPIVVLALLTSGCAGARFAVTSNDARHPVSLSPALPDAQGRALSVGHGLSELGTFEFRRTSVGFFYGATGSKIDLSRELNAEVENRNGEGIVELSVRNKNCWSNYLFPLQLLPFYPGCQVVTVTGKVVKRKGAP